VERGRAIRSKMSTDYEEGELIDEDEDVRFASFEDDGGAEDDNEVAREGELEEEQNETQFAILGQGDHVPTKEQMHVSYNSISPCFSFGQTVGSFVF